MGRLLGPAEVRDLAELLGLQPTKKLGQNFVIDGNTVRRIVRVADVAAGDTVVEIGPGLGSLTLGLLEAGASVVAVEIDPRLAAQLPATVAAMRDTPPGGADSEDTLGGKLTGLAGDASGVNLTGLAGDTSDADVTGHAGDEAGANAPLAGDGAGAKLTGPSEDASGAELTVLTEDALRITELPGDPTVLVANLPYNVSVPVLLHFLEHFGSIERGLVMVQAEVGQRIAAMPGSKVYGAPSVKAAWYGRFRTAGQVSRQVFWPVPNVDSILVEFEREEQPGTEAERLATFALVDAAFQQRRKMLRQSLGSVLGVAAAASARLEAAGVAPTARGEELTVEQFLAIARA